MKRIFLILSLFMFMFMVNLSAQDKITMSWLQKQPKSIAKDFYIWRYLNQNITPTQANNAIGQVRFFNNKIFYRYTKKSKDKTLKDFTSCMRAKTKKLINKKAYCIEAGLSLYDATKLSNSELNKVIDKVKSEYPDLNKKLQILNSPIPFKSLETCDNKTFFNTFNQCGGKYRVKYFNKHFSLETLEKLKKEKEFAQTIKLIVTNLKMTKAQKSLLLLDSDDLNFKSTFHLAINAIRHDKEKKALLYLEDAFKKAYYKSEKDNILFWKYLITKDKKHLQSLSESWDVNLYTLYANDILEKEQQNIVYTIKQTKKKSSNYNTKNPFNWLSVLKNSKKMTDKKLKTYESIFTSDETLGHLAFVKERHDNYRNSYFVTPYKKHLDKLPKNRQALIYAIGRQESRFIPTSISSAYAMGTMQIMPFLSKAIAKQLKETYNIDKLLESKTNLKYANHHLNFLEKRLNHPLFIAYAYNGGIGFTRRILKEGLFKKGKYEPFLSMELLPYDETKKYGKKVLTNYFVYQNHLNKNDKTNFSKLYKKIQSPL